MSYISNTALIICTCAVACAVLQILLPEGKTGKTINLIVTAFLILILISPIKNLFLNENKLTIPTPDETKIMAEYNDKVVSTAKDNVRNSLKSLFQQNDIQVKDVYVELKTDEQGGIIIDYINIYISDDINSSQSKIINLVESNYNITPSIILEK